MMTATFKILCRQPKNIVSYMSIKANSTSSEMPSYETLAVSVPKPNVYHVELNRPKKLNTFNNSMWIELQKCFSTLSDNPECRVLVLSGQGKHFSAGIDLHDMVKMAQKCDEYDDVARKTNYMYKAIGSFQDGISSLEKCVKPVLSVSHSACIGAGVDLITASDMRYCTQDAWFQIKEVDIGLAADIGTLQRFPKIIGNTSIARELCFTGRKFDSKEALELGFVSKVFADKDSALKHVLDLAESIAKKSPVAVQYTKKSLVYSQSRPNDEGLEHIRLINQIMLQSEDLTKSAMAQATKSDPPEYDNL